MKIDLEGVALEKWGKLTQQYQVNDKTEDVILSICQCHARFIEAEKQMNEKGFLYKSPSGKVEKSPLIEITNNAQKQMKDHYRYLENYLIPEEIAENEEDDAEWLE